MPAVGGFGMPSSAMDLSYGGGGLQSQVQDETEEERKRRLARQQAMAALSPAARSLGTGFGGTTMGIGQL
jgi:hypothetical protein